MIVNLNAEIDDLIHILHIDSSLPFLQATKSHLTRLSHNRINLSSFTTLDDNILINLNKFDIIITDYYIEPDN